VKILLKPGINLYLKIKSSVKVLVFIAVALSLGLPMLACGQKFSTLQNLTATASDVQPEEISTPNVISASPTNTPYPATQTPFEVTALKTSQTITETQAKATPVPTEILFQDDPILYYTQGGDTLPAVAARFGVSPDEIDPQEPISLEAFITPGRLLLIPNRLTETGPSELLLPDSEIVYSPSTVDFDIQGFIDQAGGYLSTYREYRDTGWHTGAQVIERVSRENSFNPRLLLALLEYEAHWVYGQPVDEIRTEYPLGWISLKHKDLYFQLTWAAQQLSSGYYGWRSGILTELVFPDGRTQRISPNLNAGSVALQYLYSKLYEPTQWTNGLYDAEQGLLAVHERMFDDPWVRSQNVEPLFPENLTQAELELPFTPGHTWNFTGGPHSAWGINGPMAALDFAPVGIVGCGESTEWVTAVAPGIVVRSANGVLVIDLDGDGYEQTGWSILYLHIAHDGSLPVGALFNKNDPLGHPSCEGGTSTGTHVHIARKYNGEWMLADGPIPFVLSGWEAQAGDEPYLGTLSKDDQIIQANIYSSFETVIKRPKE
jgi:LasA protease